MADDLQDGLNFLSSEMKAHASTNVLYRRGDKSVTLPATLGSSTFTLDEIEGARRSFTSISFDVQAADLAWDAQQRRPKLRDEIVLGDRVFEVTTPPGQERHWKWLSGQVGVRLRIHTKHVGAE